MFIYSTQYFDRMWIASKRIYDPEVFLKLCRKYQPFHEFFGKMVFSSSYLIHCTWSRHLEDSRFLTSQILNYDVSVSLVSKSFRKTLLLNIFRSKADSVAISNPWSWAHLSKHCAKERNETFLLKWLLPTILDKSYGQAK